MVLVCEMIYCTNIVFIVIHCLRYVWYEWHFERWPWSHVRQLSLYSQIYLLLFYFEISHICIELVNFFNVFANEEEEEEEKFASAFRACIILIPVLYAAFHRVSVFLQKSHIASKQHDQKYDSFCYSTCYLGFTTWNSWIQTFRLRIHCPTSRWVSLVFILVIVVKFQTFKEQRNCYLSGIKISMLSFSWTSYVFRPGSR
jgi:hypothetical protein